MSPEHPREQAFRKEWNRWRPAIPTMPCPGRCGDVLKAPVRVQEVRGDGSMWFQTSTFICHRCRMSFPTFDGEWPRA